MRHIVYANGLEIFLVNGKLHSEDGPAKIHPTGTEEWYRNGRHYRSGGPVIVGLHGYEQWYYDFFYANNFPREKIK